MIEAVGYAAYGLNVMGTCLLAYKSIWGWVFRVVSISLWGIYASEIESGPMITNAITFFAINCFGLWKWR